MPTPSEQKALAFVAIVIVLGGAVRVLRAGPPPIATPAEQQAIARQATAADSASANARRPKKGKKGAKVAYGRRDTVGRVVAGVAGVPYSDVRPGSPTDVTPTPGSRFGYQPPSPRIDSDNRLPGATTVPAPAAPAPGKRGKGGDPANPIDVDVATAAEIERLPRIGPALAARIVASRDSLGPFKSLEGLGRVRGVGPAMLRQLGPLVTFSGRRASFEVRDRY
jgi:DNA uptake protein and related DNA-binding proteins